MGIFPLEQVLSLTHISLGAAAVAPVLRHRRASASLARLLLLCATCSTHSPAWLEFFFLCGFVAGVLTTWSYHAQ
jgi:hypothetical protein